MKKKEEFLSELTDNGTTTSTARHVFRGDYFGNRGEDKCLEIFGEQDEECIAYNKNLALHNK